MRLFSLLLLISSTLIAQDKSTAVDIGTMADTLYQVIDNKDPGAYVAAVQNGKNTAHRSYGLASVEHGVPVSDSTIFDLASIAKMFTGYAIATLETRGQLRSEDDIHTYLPDFPDMGQEITVAHLLHHTSGIKNWTSLLYESGYHYSNRIKFDYLLRLIYAQRSLDFTPGERYKYSNSGYVLLAEIIEKVSGKSYAEWMEEEVFAPLGMTKTFFHDTPGRVIPNVARGYSQDNDGNFRRDFDNTTAVGSSSLFSCGSDMQKWMKFLLGPGPERQAIVDLMFTTRPLNDGEHNTYAYGIDVEDYRGTKMIGHSGSWASYTSQMFLLPEFNAGVFFVHNFRVRTSDIAYYFADGFLPEEEEVEEEAEAEEEETISYSSNNLPDETVDTKLLDTYTGKFKLGVGWYLDIIREGEKMYAQANGERAFLMYAANDTTFVVPNYGYRTITFLKNESGEVDAIIYNKKRRERQVEPFRFDAEALQPYVGTYYNHELGLVFNFTLQEDGLYATNINFPPAKIIDTGQNQFITDGRFRTIIFTHTKDGTIDGFYTANSRGEKIWSYKKAK
ncbi:MAG: serine hydrolase [Bacteroidota bacterium]